MKPAIQNGGKLQAASNSGLVIQTGDLTKTYGSSRGILELNLQVRQGEVFGFLGPNGAGKTTTIRLLLNLIKPTGGKATVLVPRPQCFVNQHHKW
jgi:ABC-2 type transport system ATP-binding protein